MKKLLSAVISSIGEIAACLESDPAILSAMPKEMVGEVAKAADFITKPLNKTSVK